MFDRKRSREEERSYARMVKELEELEAGVERMELSRRLLPADWHLLEADAPLTAKKRKITLALDADMVAWFRGLGRGYQPRMNAVLRAYMLAVHAKAVERPGDRDWRGEPI